ncbi:restriction endonuclease subunit S [Vibrio mediterranei]|uniref:Restriction endonuclease subunit S n=1 Tax=Vibrio mediterranei TaxID=689 RepID=A0A3G4VIM0_9VIBR|nr:restriction endonuclease subunit S [Vibrio mediterranei]AYV24653.1 restriction endonuclease subunit S [Vibrio mediterranei]
MSWPLVKLTEVAEVNPRCPKDIDEDQIVSFVAMASASEAGLLLGEELKVLKDTKKGFTYFERGDVLLAKITPCFENGKTLRPYQIKNQVGFGSTEFHVVRADLEKLDPTYLFYLLWSDAFRFLGTNAMAGAAGQKRVGTPFLKQLEIPLPPLDEQKRIAAILDKADAIRQKRKQAIDLADEFLRSVFLDMFGDPVTNPKGWDVKRLEELISEGDKLNYGVVQPGDDDENGVPLVRSGDLYDSGTPLSKVRRVSSSVDEKHRKSRLKGNEILIACVGSIGKVGWVDESMVGWNIARAVTRIPLKDSVNREYIFRYLQSPVIQGYFQKETRAVAQPTLNVGLISKTPIALPPQEQQDEFLKVHNKVNSFKQNAIVKSKHMDEMFKSLSQKAFSGQL